jgi:hypothetical protein
MIMRLRLIKIEIRIKKTLESSKKMALRSQAQSQRGPVDSIRPPHYRGLVKMNRTQSRRKSLEVSV